MAAEPRRARLLLAVGAAAGLVVALIQALGAGLPRAMPQEAVAVVGERAITREDLARALSAMEADKRNPLTDADRKMALQRLVEEEALVQRGITLGVAADDPAVRKAIVQAMVQFATSQAIVETPSDAELRRFHAERPRLFATAQQMRVRVLALTDATAAARAGELLSAGARIDDVAAKLKVPLAPAPDRLLSRADLGTYFGPTVTQVALSLQAGETAGPIEAGGARVFIQALERVDAPPPPFEAVREVVLAEWRRAREEGALDRYLEKLRREADVRYAPDAPK